MRDECTNGNSSAGNELAANLITELRRANKVVLTEERLELLPTRGPATGFVRRP